MFICIITDPETGGTFVDWTIYYLSGATEYFSLIKKTNLPLPHNPLNNTNAHGFRGSKIGWPETFNYDFDLAKSQPNLQTMYFHHLRRDIPESNDLHVPTQNAIHRAMAESDKQIFITLKPKHELYRCGYNRRILGPRLDDPSQNYSSHEEEHQHFVQTFFNTTDINNWQQQDIWDKREYLALSLPIGHYNSSIRPYVSDTGYQQDAFELYTKFDIFAMFDYLDKKIDQTRLAHWKHIYKKWQTFHQQRVKFTLDFDQIVDAILHNKALDLVKYKLDLVQEAAIQKTIMSYGLNFKTWQLNKFQNTQQLHSLLEPNIH